MTTLRVFLILVFSTPLWSVSLLQDFDSLGGNASLLKKLQEGQSQKGGIQIVQKRIVDRTNRWEFSSEYLQTSRGNSYLDSTSSGAAISYHINPHWSLGIRYNHFYNKLTQEGQSLVEEARKIESMNPKREVAIIPELNWPKNSLMASVSFYPIYGKINLFDMGVVHFDIYGTLGVGKMELRQGSSQTYSGGVGIGFWPSQYLSSRLEYNYQLYDVEYLSGKSGQRVNTISFGIGILL